MTPTFINFLGFWVLELPLAWWLAVRMHLHQQGAFLAVVIAECSIALGCLLLFRRGRWKTVRV